jgi:hypothetical protein
MCRYLARSKLPSIEPTRCASTSETGCRRPLSSSASKFRWPKASGKPGAIHLISLANLFGSVPDVLGVWSRNELVRVDFED